MLSPSRYTRPTHHLTTLFLVSHLPPLQTHKPPHVVQLAAGRQCHGHWTSLSLLSFCSSGLGQVCTHSFASTCRKISRSFSTVSTQTTANSLPNLSSSSTDQDESVKSKTEMNSENQDKSNTEKVRRLEIDGYRIYTCPSSSKVRQSQDGSKSQSSSSSQNGSRMVSQLTTVHESKKEMRKNAILVGHPRQLVVGFNSRTPENNSETNQSQVYSIVDINNSQHRVMKGDLLMLDKLRHTSVGDKLFFNNVLLLASGDWSVIGRPYIHNCFVLATVEEHSRTTKKLVFKFRRRKGYRRFKTSRDYVTLLRIDDILQPDLPTQLINHTLQPQLPNST